MNQQKFTGGYKLFIHTGQKMQIIFQITVIFILSDHFPSWLLILSRHLSERRFNLFNTAWRRLLSHWALNQFSVPVFRSYSEVKFVSYKCSFTFKTKIATECGTWAAWWVNSVFQLSQQFGSFDCSMGPNIIIQENDTNTQYARMITSKCYVRSF